MEKKKNIFKIIWEAMIKSGGCCGSGESCCDSSKKIKRDKRNENIKNSKV